MSNMIIKDQLRSTSLPSRSHPMIEEVLNKVQTINTTTDSSKSILIGLAGLEELYDCLEDFLNMSSTQRILSSDSELKEEMLDGSLRLMDICNVSRDLMVETHEHVRCIQSYVRRKKVGGEQDVAISGYLGFRKNMRKEAKKLLGSLKKIQEDEHLVKDTMRLVVSVTVSILRSFLEFLLGRSKSNMKSKLASVLKKKKDCCNKEIKNEFESLDYVICYSSDDDLQKKLEDVEVSIDGFEKNLEVLFRKLIRTRASLLNIISY